MCKTVQYITDQYKTLAHRAWLLVLVTLFGCDTSNSVSPAEFTYDLPDPAELTVVAKTGGSSSNSSSGRFHYPIGNASTPTITAHYLEQGCSGSTDYLPGEYHLGVDYRGSVGTPVIAISDGMVRRRSDNGWGSGNVGIVIEHELSNGMKFLALYAHITSGLNGGDMVTAGSTIGHVGRLSTGDHLHFGITLDFSMPGSPWGKMPCGNWPNVNNMIEPTSWLATQTPKANTPSLGFSDQVAYTDMERFTSNDARFGDPILITFGKNLDYQPWAELRWVQYSFTQGRTVVVYHLTYKYDRSMRWITYRDPDTGLWRDWIRV